MSPPYWHEIEVLVNASHKTQMHAGNVEQQRASNAVVQWQVVTWMV